MKDTSKFRIPSKSYSAAPHPNPGQDYFCSFFFDLLKMSQNTSYHCFTALQNLTRLSQKHHNILFKWLIFCRAVISDFTRIWPIPRGVPRFPEMWIIQVLAQDKSPVKIRKSQNGLERAKNISQFFS